MITSRRRVGLGLAVSIAGPLLLLRPTPAWAAASINVNPSSGPAGQTFAATYHFVPGPNGCPQGNFAVQFRWDAYPGPNATGSEGQALGSAPLDTGPCSATLPSAVPPPGASAGNHQVWAFVDSGQGTPIAPTAVSDPPATYTIQVNPPTSPPTTSPSTTRPTSPPTTSQGPPPTTAPVPTSNPATSLTTSTQTTSSTTTTTVTATTQTTPGGSPTSTAPGPGGTQGPKPGGGGGLPALQVRSLGNVGARMPPDFGERVPWAIGAGVLVGLVTVFGLALARPPAGVSRWALVVPLAVAAAGTPVVGGVLIDRPTVKLSVDGVRVTQGLDWDVDDGAGVAYDLIGGKDVLVRTDLRAAEPTEDTTLAKASCHVLRVTTVTYSGSKFPTGFEEVATVPAVVTPTSTFLSTGGKIPSSVAKTWRVDCWVQGYQVHPPGDYLFWLDARVAGQKAQALELGTRSFLPTGDYRLYVYPWVLPDNGVTVSEGYPWGYCTKIPVDRYKTDCPKVDPRKIYYPWTSALLPTFFGAMDEFQRMMPVRSGAGTFDWTGKTHTAGLPGLRYSFGPIVDCTDDWPTDSAGMRTVETGCDGRPAAELAAAAANAKLAAADASDGRHRDRFDQHLVLSPLRPGLPGGGQCRGGHLMGAAIDESNPTGWDGYLWTHELGHCLGQVGAGDPHACAVNPACTKAYGADKAHVKNRPGGGNRIPLYAGLPMVNTQTRTDDPAPQSVMGWDTDWGPGASNFFFEGWEWNALRTTLLTRPRADGVTDTYRLASSSPEVPRFVVLGAFAGNGVVVTHSQRTADQLAPTPDVPGGAFDLVFVDGAGLPLDRVGFGPSSPGGEGGSGTDVPDSYRGDGFMLARALPDGATRAEIRRGDTVLFAQALGGSPPALGAVRAAMTADGTQIEATWSAPGGGGLSSNVWLDLGAGEPPRLAAVGLRSPRIVLPTAFVPTTAHAHVIVEASDGFNTARSTSNEFAIRDRPPTAIVLAPARDTSGLYAGRPATLTGVGYDPTVGTLDGRALTWRSDHAGVLGHGARIAAVLPPGEQTVTLEATAPSGLHAVASVRVRVRPAAEAPLVTVRPPALPTAFALSSDRVSLGTCPGASTATVNVRPLTPGTILSAASDSHWLEVEGRTPTGDILLRANCTGLAGGVRYTGRVLVSAGPDQSQIVSVTLGRAAAIGSREPVFLGLIALGGWAATSLPGGAGLRRWRRRRRPDGRPRRSRAE